MLLNCTNSNVLSQKICYFWQMSSPICKIVLAVLEKRISHNKRFRIILRMIYTFS